jgi:hypothetical protein
VIGAGYLPIGTTPRPASGKVQSGPLKSDVCDPSIDGSRLRVKKIGAAARNAEHANADGASRPKKQNAPRGLQGAPPPSGKAARDGA